MRDTTATVESIPLIASSIMSKKIAEGTDALVLDVKIGSGAFIPDPDRGDGSWPAPWSGWGPPTGCAPPRCSPRWISPWAARAGNALEVEESVEVLAGGGPADVVEVTLALAREMVDLAGLDIDPADALADGRAMDRWRAMVAAQGGDPDAPLPVATENDMVRADADGVLQRLDARAVGVAAWRLGAGRARKEDKVSATAGVICHAKVGDVVRAGEPLLELRTDESHRFASAREALADGWTIGPEPAEPLTADPRPDHPRLSDWPFSICARTAGRNGLHRNQRPKPLTSAGGPSSSTVPSRRRGPGW